MWLRRLKTLSLEGEFRHIFGLLRQLALPEMLDELHLTVFHPTVGDISQALVPYMRDYFRRDPRFQDRLGVSSSNHSSVSISVGVVRTQAAMLGLELPMVSLTVFTVPNMLEQLLLDLITPIPRERVVSLNPFKPDTERELPPMMPNIETLCISDVELSGGFLQPNPDGPRTNKKLLPSLRFLSLQDLTLRDNS